MIVVSDTSPILNLARVGRLELLYALYNRVLIPPAVYKELTAAKLDESLLTDLTSTPWLVVDTPKDQDRVKTLRADLDPGEAEAIVLAVERQADLLLVDERRGRKIAGMMGLRITGLLGVLAEAKRARLIAQVKPVLDELIHHSGFWIGENLYAHVLAKAGEK